MTGHRRPGSLAGGFRSPDVVCGSNVDDDLERNHVRATLSIAGATCMASLASQVWYPFLPLFLLDMGVKDEATAVFWVAAASSALGIGRLLSGPVWGVVSDRFGRKAMFLRALYLGCITGFIVGFAREPWQVALALGLQGLLSGFIPASVALMSVSVPDSRLPASLSLVTGAQYLGSTVGPALGAVLAISLGYRGAIFTAAFLPALVATAVIFFVPADRVANRQKSAAGDAPAALEPFRPGFQFWLAISVYLIIYASTQLVRLATPIALVNIEHTVDVAGITGLAFTLGGFSSAVSVLVLTGRFFGAGRLRLALIASCALTGGAYLLLSESGAVPFYVLSFALLSLFQAAMVPTTNTLIAANISRARRGTAFGIAAAAQAIAFVIGPSGAAFFTAISLRLGFTLLGGLFLVLSGVLLGYLREPSFRAVAAPAISGQ